jgi:predicted Zn-dependent peptidase
MALKTMYQVTRIQNGLTVATAEMPHMASVSLGLWVGVGGRYEPKELNGVSHFIEHMLFKGTRGRSAKEISQAVEGIGGYLNAFTSEENTCFYSKARHDKFDELLDVLMDMFLNSVFEKPEIDKERDVIKEELAMYLDQPHHHVQELLNETLWPDHPLGRSLTGTERTLDGMGRRQLLNYQDENYVTGTTLIVAAGNLRHDKVTKAVRRYADKFPRGKPPNFQPFDSEQDAPRVRVFTKDTAQMQLALGIRACSRHDDRRFALRVLNTMLGENMSSRLFQVLREDHGLAYSIHSGLSFFDEVGTLTVSAGLDTDKLEQALKLITRELRRCAENVPTAGELRRARDYLIGQFDIGLESTENQMTWLGEQLLAYGKIVSPAESKKRLSKVTAHQVRAVARQFFRPERMNLAVVSPLKDAAGLKELLRW